MIDAAHRKLTDQKGASLLLALLFLLICTMVSASILMAATSNAGKKHSNQQEHQAYLAISSAVNLLCTELTTSEYQGGYICTQTNVDGVRQQKIEQADGKYTGKLASILQKDLDGLFGKEIEKIAAENGFYTEGIKTMTGLNHTLTIQPQTGTVLDEQVITIQLNVVERSYAIELTAQLEDYRMQAELTPVTTRPTLPELPDFDTGEIQYTEPLTWRIGWITTGEGEQS